MPYSRLDATRLADDALRHQLRLAAVRDDAAPQLLRALALLDERRGPALTRALGVALITPSGIVCRVVDGSGPLAVVVGRHEGCDLFLPRAEASLRHFVVVADDEGARVVDLGSQLGVDGDVRVPVVSAGVVRSADCIAVVVVVGPGRHFVDVREPRLPPLPTMQARATARSSSSSSMSVVSLSSVPRDGALLIGRGERCGVVVRDDRVSRVHAAVVVVVRDGARQALVVDLGATNGTTVLKARGARVVEVELGPVRRATLVADGDLLLLSGDVRLQIGGTIGVGDDDDASYDRDRGNA